MVYAIIEGQLRASFAKGNETLRILGNRPADYKDGHKP
jgi:hypothetical protein